MPGGTILVRLIQHRRAWMDFGALMPAYQWEVRVPTIRTKLEMLTHLFGVQQSPAELAALLASCCIAQSSVGGSSISPKSPASESQTAAISASFADRPLGLCVVQRINVVLNT